MAAQVMAQRFDIGDRQFSLTIDGSSFAVTAAGGTAFSDFVQHAGELAARLGFVGPAYAGIRGAAPDTNMQEAGISKRESGAERGHSEETQAEANQCPQCTGFGVITATSHEACAAEANEKMAILESGVQEAAAYGSRLDVEAEVEIANHNELIQANGGQFAQNSGFDGSTAIDQKNTLAEANEDVGNLRSAILEAAAEAARLEAGMASTSTKFKHIAMHFAQYAGIDAIAANFRL